MKKSNKKQNVQFRRAKITKKRNLKNKAIAPKITKKELREVCKTLMENFSLDTHMKILQNVLSEDGCSIINAQDVLNHVLKCGMLDVYSVFNEDKGEYIDCILPPREYMLDNIDKIADLNSDFYNDFDRKYIKEAETLLNLKK